MCGCGLPRPSPEIPFLACARTTISAKGHRHTIGLQLLLPEEVVLHYGLLGSCLKQASSGRDIDRLSAAVENFGAVPLSKHPKRRCPGKVCSNIDMLYARVCHLARVAEPLYSLARSVAFVHAVYTSHTRAHTHAGPPLCGRARIFWLVSVV